MKKLTAVAFILLLTACVPDPKTPTPPPPVEGDACHKACAAWAHFAETDESCKKEAEPNKAGKKCDVLCREVEANDWTTMYPECIPKAADCKQAKKFSSEGCDGY